MTTALALPEVMLPVPPVRVDRGGPVVLPPPDVTLPHLAAREGLDRIPGAPEALTWQGHVQRWLFGYPSPRTRQEYARDTRQWEQWCGALGIEPLAASRDHVQAYSRVLESRYSQATVARRIASLAALYAYLVDEEALARTPVRGRRPRSPMESRSTGLTEREAAKLLDAAEQSSLRDCVLVGMLYLLGLRVSEALTTRVEDMCHERGHRTITVTRKGGRRDRLPLPPELAARVDELVGDAETGTVIRTATGRPVCRSHAWRIVRRLARTAELPQASTLHPHDLRHAFATASLDAQVPLRDVQDAMGHADPRTTRRYDRSRGRIDRHPGSTLASRLAAYRTDHSAADGQIPFSA